MGLAGLYVGVKLLLFSLLLLNTAAKQRAEGVDEKHDGAQQYYGYRIIPQFLNKQQQLNANPSDSFHKESGPPVGHFSQDVPVSGSEISVLLAALLPQSLDLSHQRLRRRTPISERSEGAGHLATPGDTPIPAEYSVFVVLQPGVAVTNTSVQARILQALASMLNLPTSNVILKQTHASLSALELYVLRAGHQLVTAEDLVPASDVEKEVSSSQLSSALPDIKVQAIYTKMEASPLGNKDSVWGQPFFPYVLAVGILLFLAAAFALIYCCCMCRRNKGFPSPSRSSPSPPAHIPQQICLYPTAKPDVNNATLIQPDITQIYTNKSCGLCETPVHTPPMRLKKGLLERRGSNASLTLDLGPPTDKPTWGSPPRESSSEEYLLSAGNRMSRKQLRSCLKNVKSLYEEFWEIPMNHPDRVEIPGSGMKNRYRTIIPNEYTRVKLPEEENDILTTYINANYIRGYAAEPHAYIATQGPMSHTVIDFWRMIWHERAPIVVMITKLKEKNKIKCESYLPEHIGQYGNIEVEVVNSQEKDGYILRRVKLRCKGEEQFLLHYWYTTWPDHKAPNTAKTLLQLVKEVDINRYMNHSHTAKGPVIIHCSAGIGRTGCFIATSIGMLQLREEHSVDILGIVCSMRLDRGGMVQTNEQYEFVHQALCLYERELPARPPSGE